MAIFHCYVKLPEGTLQFEGKVHSEMCSVWFEIQPGLEKKKHVAVQSEQKQATQAKGRHPSSFPISQNGVK